MQGFLIQCIRCFSKNYHSTLLLSSNIGNCTYSQVHSFFKTESTRNTGQYGWLQMTSCCTAQFKKIRDIAQTVGQTISLENFSNKNYIYN